VSTNLHRLVLWTVDVVHHNSARKIASFEDVKSPRWSTNYETLHSFQVLLLLSGRPGQYHQSRNTKLLAPNIRQIEFRHVKLRIAADLKFQVCISHYIISSTCALIYHRDAPQAVSSKCKIRNTQPWIRAEKIQEYIEAYLSRRKSSYPQITLCQVIYLRMYISYGSTLSGVNQTWNTEALATDMKRWDFGHLK